MRSSLREQNSRSSPERADRESDCRLVLPGPVSPSGRYPSAAVQTARNRPKRPPLPKKKHRIRETRENALRRRTLDRSAVAVCD